MELATLAFSLTPSLNGEKCTFVSSLTSRYEEADTKVSLRAGIAETLGYPSVNILPVDSDVSVLALLYQTKLTNDIYLTVQV